MRFDVETLSGFKCQDPIIEVIDNRGLAFYFFSNPSCNEIKFNLIKGSYYTNNDLEKIDKPLIYVPYKLPRFEKNINIHENLELNVTENPNKASIDVSKGLIIIDKKYYNESETPFTNFILFHELGHYYYKTEYKCDIFSAYQMLKLGFNPTQCFYANSICLSDNQIERKQILFNYLKKTKIL